jgi:hypothetical protein
MVSSLDTQAASVATSTIPQTMAEPLT